jgi:hypothetical protein
MTHGRRFLDKGVVKMAQHARLMLEVGLSEALARRLERLFDAPHDAKEEAMLLDYAWEEINNAYKRGAARLYRFMRSEESNPHTGLRPRQRVSPHPRQRRR